MMLKNKHIIIWIAFILISIALIGPNPDPNGVVVTFIDKSSDIREISVGDVIFRINDREAALPLLEENFTGLVKFETSRGSKFENINGSLGLGAEPVQKTNLHFGLDLKGGIRAIIEPNETENIDLQNIISILETRINIFGLREANFRPLTSENKEFIEVSIAGGTIEELKDLLESQGKFEAKIPIRLAFADNKTELRLDETYTITKNNGEISINGETLRVNESFTISGIEFFVNSFDENELIIVALVFSGDDIKTVYFDPQRSQIETLDDGFRWSFAVQISLDGAQRFAHVTQNLGIIPGGYLDSQIELYLDDELIDALNIVSTLKGSVQTEISITGGAVSIDHAIAERARLQSILRSGALPTAIEIVQLDTISPNLGSEFIINAAFVGLLAIIAVLVVVSIRYKKIKLVIPMMFVSLSEVLIILGLATGIGWTIDLAAIAGIIAAVGTGIDSQIIILDQSLRGEEFEEGLKQKLKRAFFIIFGSGGTIIAAMLPLMTIGFGVVRGFAIVTIIGVLVGILITRPAFGVIVERLTKE